MKHISVEMAAEHGFGRAFLEGVSDYAALKSDACLHSVSQDHLPTTRALARMDGLILRLFGNAFERQSTQHIPVSPRWLSRALLSIHQNLAAGISAGDGVRLSGFSAPVVERVFEERFGMSVIGYLTEERMKLAKKLLKTTDLQAKPVAAACDYASQQYFCRVFRTRYGQSPRQIR